ncbi:MAG: hypothetical protein LBK75_06865 [Oscillospiraceae bacterium]|jgi:hypothetical protein|nr:hypothetical protein [Oscillospiraceae bacterium]
MDKHTVFLSLYSYPIVTDLAARKNINKAQALDLYYNSKFYRLYEKESTKLWHFSKVTLSKMLDKEITTGNLEIPVEG